MTSASLRLATADSLHVPSVLLDGARRRECDLVLGSFALAYLVDPQPPSPVWWIAFPPMVDVAMVGNPDVAVLALLVVAGGRLRALAPLLKIYALIPMIGERRWRQFVLASALLAVTVIVLPSGGSFAQLPTVTEYSR